MVKDIICVACPMGCQISVELNDDGEILSVTGNTCKRGDAYARTECTHPERSLTTTVKVSGGVHPVVPVKSAKAVPKDKVKDCVKEIAKLEIKAPVKIGDVVCANILGTGVDIVASAFEIAFKDIGRMLPSRELFEHSIGINIRPFRRLFRIEGNFIAAD